MPIFVRVFVRVNIREERWFRDGTPWVPEGEVSADALRDLQTTGGALSVFRISAAVDARRIVAAWFAVGPSRDKPTDIGFLTFEGDAVVATLRLPIESRAEGATADPAVDALHHDIRELTAIRLAQLAAIMAQGETDVILRKELSEILAAGLRAGTLQRDRINGRLLAALGATGQV